MPEGASELPPGGAGPCPRWELAWLVRFPRAASDHAFGGRQGVAESLQGRGGRRVPFRELYVIVVVSHCVDEILWRTGSFRGESGTDLSDISFQLGLAMEHVSEGSSDVTSGTCDQAL